MNIIENIVMALEGIKLNKMRSFLTMLGIIIGIGSVIGIMTIGDALTKSVSDGFSSYNKALVSIRVSPKEGRGWQDIQLDSDKIKLSQIERIKEIFKDNIKSLLIYGADTTGTVKNGRNSEKLYVTGVTDGQADYKSIKMITGRFLTEDDDTQGKEVIVISDKAADSIYGVDYGQLLGKELPVDTTNGLKIYIIVGIYKNETENFGALQALNQNNSNTTEAYIPRSVSNRQFLKDKSKSDLMFSFTIVGKTPEAAEYLSKEVPEYFNKHYFEDNDKATVVGSTIQSELNQINQVMGAVSIAIGAIAAISLIVGGIGVMNILLVSVTERTREIGIRKALGATNNNIRMQFIVESIIICVIGGIMGIALGMLIGFVGSNIMGKPTISSLFSIIVATVFSMFIGVFFGYYPANKAAKLNPIDALRYE